MEVWTTTQVMSIRRPYEVESYRDVLMIHGVLTWSETLGLGRLLISLAKRRKEIQIHDLIFPNCKRRIYSRPSTKLVLVRGRLISNPNIGWHPHLLEPFQTYALLFYPFPSTATIDYSDMPLDGVKNIVLVSLHHVRCAHRLKAL